MVRSKSPLLPNVRMTFSIVTVLVVIISPLQSFTICYRQQGGQRIQLKRNTFQKGEQGGPVAKAGRKDSNEGGGQRR